MPDVESLVVQERSDDGSRTVTQWVGVASDFKLKIRWTEEDIWDDAARVCKFTQVKGDYQSYGGNWTFTDLGNGQTKFSSVLTYEFEIPLIGPLLKKVVAKLMRENTQRLLDAIKTRAEQPAAL
ncbi:MAG: Oligoketide cyclase/lipid transport protein, partial [Capsulimonas sp.]|nr:Oligoketide cyclase/lipid transport protein [Capsulimonas sp.]